MDTIKIPQEVLGVVAALQKGGFEAYPVGGCVRDVLLGKKPKDWDVTTNAMPEEIRNISPKSFYENKFYTVTAETDSSDETLREIEITTFRSEGRYEDKRHPAEIKPAKTLEEDLSRRDFTINAMAYDVSGKKLIDLFCGAQDLDARIIRAVGDARERFSEDALRMLRAVRLATGLHFSLEEKTKEAIRNHASELRAISKERIRDEFMKIIMSDNAMKGVQMLSDMGLMEYFLPEMEEGIGVEQNKHHIYTVWEHNIRALDFAASERYSPMVRLAAWFHDIAKPRCKRGEGPDSTFYNHDVVGAKMSAEAMDRLKFSRAEVERVSRLVRWHLFNYEFEDDEAKTTDASIRRLIRNVGEENIEDLVKVRMCDRIGSGVPKAAPYRLRHFQFRVEKVLREKEAVKVTMLNINGQDLMDLLAIHPGPRIGHMLNALLEEVIDDPEKNSKEYLEKRAKELHVLSDQELFDIRKKAEEKVDLLEDTREAEIKKKYYVK